jgi:hypothetical protein
MPIVRAWKAVEFSLWSDSPTLTGVPVWCTVRPSQGVFAASGAYRCDKVLGQATAQERGSALPCALVNAEHTLLQLLAGPEGIASASAFPLPDLWRP